jgi:putative redox protein
MTTATTQDKFGASLVARQHQILSGVATTLGGDDEGLNPHELLEASLAACTVITLDMYAQRKGIALKSEVEVKSVTEGGATRLTRQLKLTGDLTPEQRLRLVEIANACPIHKLLSGKITVDTQLVGA